MLIDNTEVIFFTLSTKFIAEQGATSVEKSDERGHKP